MNLFTEMPSTISQYLNWCRSETSSTTRTPPQNTECCILWMTFVHMLGTTEIVSLQGVFSSTNFKLLFQFVAIMSYGSET